MSDRSDTRASSVSKIIETREFYFDMVTGKIPFQFLGLSIPVSSLTEDIFSSEANFMTFYLDQRLKNVEPLAFPEFKEFIFNYGPTFYMYAPIHVGIELMIKMFVGSDAAAIKLRLEDNKTSVLPKIHGNVPNSDKFTDWWNEFEESLISSDPQVHNFAMTEFHKKYVQFFQKHFKRTKHVGQHSSDEDVPDEDANADTATSTSQEKQQDPNEKMQDNDPQSESSDKDENAEDHRQHQDEQYLLSEADQLQHAQDSALAMKTESDPNHSLDILNKPLQSEYRVPGSSISRVRYCPPEEPIPLPMKNLESLRVTVFFC